MGNLLMKSLEELKSELSVIRREKLKAVKEQNFEKACSWREKERDLLEIIEPRDPEIQKEKLMNQKRGDLSEFLNTLAFELNTVETRTQVCNKISELWEFEFKDATTPEMIDDGFMSFKGYNPETKTVTDLTISNSK